MALPALERVADAEAYPRPLLPLVQRRHRQAGVVGDATREQEGLARTEAWTTATTITAGSGPVGRGRLRGSGPPRLGTDRPTGHGKT